MQTDSPNEEVDSGDSGDAGGGGATAAGNFSTRARSYECNFCRRGFLNAQALGGHMNIHRRDRAKKTLMKEGAYNYSRCFGANYNPATSSSRKSVDMRREEEGVDEGEAEKLDGEAGELDLELRLWPGGTGRNKGSSRFKG